MGYIFTKKQDFLLKNQSGELNYSLYVVKETQIAVKVSGEDDMQNTESEIRDSASNETILIVTPWGKKILKLLLMSFSILAVIALIIFNWPLLFENPFSATLHWDIPVLAYRNTKGNTAVVDKDGERVVILNRDGEVRATLQANRFSSRAITYVQDIAIDDNYVYVLDLQHSSNGAQINGEKVMIYDLDGKYISTPYKINHPKSTERENFFCSISCHNGSLFVSKREKGKVIIYQIVHEELKPYQTFEFPGKEIFTSVFMPDTRSSYVVTKDGCHYLNYLNDSEELPMVDGATYWSDVCIAPSGERYYLNANRHEIVQFRPNAKKKQLIQLTSRDESREIPKVFGTRMTLQGDILNWCYPTQNEVVTFDTASWSRTVSTEVQQPIRYLLFRGVVWTLAILFAGFLGKNVIAFIGEVYRSFRKRNGADNGQAEDTQNPLTAWSIYGITAFTLIFAFIAVTAVITTFYSARAWQIMESSARTTAASLKNLPASLFGDYLEEIDAPKDRNRKEFALFSKIADSCCHSEEDSTFDLGFSALRKLPSGEYMIVIDSFDRYNMGKIVNKTDPDLADMYKKLTELETDRILAVNEIERTGSNIFYAATKILNSKGEEAGVIIISCSKDKVASATHVMLAQLSVDLLLLFILFVLLCGEFKLAWGFRKLRKLDPTTKKLMQTVGEGHRTSNFLACLTLSLDAAFLPTLAIQLAGKSGIGGSMNVLAATPLSARSLLLVLALIFSGFLAKYTPRKYMRFGALLSILCFAIQIHAVLAGKFYLFLIGVAALGVTQGIKCAALAAISESTAQPSLKFQHFIGVNTECLIGTTAGASLGSLLCSKFGYASVFFFGILMEFLLYYVAGAFITDDINLARGESIFHDPKNTIRRDWTKIREIIHHVLRPDLLVLLLCVMIPMSFLGQFDSYVLPIYNATNWELDSYIPAIYGAQSGQLLTGFVGAVTKILALLLIPYAFSKLQFHGARGPLLAGLLLITFGFVFFAFDNTLFAFSCLLLLITIFNIIFSTTADRIRMSIAHEDNVKFTDTIGVFHALQAIGASLAPLLLGFGLKIGFKAFSLVFAGFLLVMLLVFTIFSSHLRKAEI